MGHENQREMQGILKETSHKTRKRSLFGEVFNSVAIAVLLAVLIRLFVLEPFYIPSESMKPTLNNNDRIIVSKLNYRFQEPKRGDIIVFKYPKDTQRNFVKRLIAVGGETVAVKKGRLYINGQVIQENYLPPGLLMDYDYGPVEVPKGNYFMLGDNRNSSSDSHEWGFLPEKLIVGKVIFLYWPLSRIGIVQ